MPVSERSSSQKRERPSDELTHEQQRPLAADDVRGATDGAALVDRHTPNTLPSEVGPAGDLSR